VKIKFLNLPCLCLVFYCPIFWAFNATALGLAGTRANDVTSIEYNGLSPVIQIHTARIFTDYERHGFFRIGLLPIPVAENVQIQIRSADYLTNALYELHSWDDPSAGVKRLELRTLEIGLFGDKQPRLSAVTARVGQNGTLELSTVSLFDAADQQMSIPKATLQIAGSSTGWLHWNCDGQLQDVFLFKPKPDKTP